MKITKGKAVYELPKDFDYIHHVFIDERETCGIFQMLNSLTLRDMLDITHNESIGVPTYYSVINDNLHLYPTPDKDYNISVRVIRTEDI